MHLRQLNDTQADYLGATNYLIANLLGDKAGLAAAKHGHEYYPDAQWYLIGDEALIRQVFDLRFELTNRPPASGLSDHDTARLGAQQGHVISRLESQRERVRRGEEPIWPSSAFLREMLAIAGEKFGVPPDYQPKVKD
jgi:hypothetical protein